MLTLLDLCIKPLYPPFSSCPPTLLGKVCQLWQQVLVPGALVETGSRRVTTHSVGTGLSSMAAAAAAVGTRKPATWSPLTESSLCTHDGTEQSVLCGPEGVVKVLPITV